MHTVHCTGTAGTATATGTVHTHKQTCLSLSLYMSGHAHERLATLAISGQVHGKDSGGRSHFRECVSTLAEAPVFRS